MAERIRTLADEIPVLQVQKHHGLIPFSFDILVGRNPKEKQEILIQQTVEISTIRKKDAIVKEEYQVKTELGQFKLIHILSSDSWHIDRLNHSEK